MRRRKASLVDSLFMTDQFTRSERCFISIALSFHPYSIILVSLGTRTWADGKSQ